MLQSQEALEAATVQYLVLQRLLAQVVQLLQQQQPDHQLRRPRRAAALAAGAQAKSAIDHRCDRGEVDVPPQQLQWIAQLLALGFALGSGKQTDHRHLPLDGNKIMMPRIGGF
nr:hypothetical protein [Xanthomonas theicola]